MSIKQDIKDNLKTSLEAILVNSGYNTTVKQVSLSPLKDDQEQPWIWIAEGSEAVKVEDDTNIRMELMLNLILYLSQQSDVQEAITKLADDVKKVIYAANLGNYVLSCSYEGQEDIAVSDSQRQAKISMMVRVVYYAPKAGF